MKKLTQGMAEHNEAMSAAKTDKEKNTIKTQKQNTTSGLRTCSNILAMTKSLHSKTPSFIGDEHQPLLERGSQSFCTCDKYGDWHWSQVQEEQKDC
ncbi:apoptosis inhibitor 5-like protein API5 [Eucalyptus grandis]|uniref:apoptosis inhibitor 5-like protein API5 n=1 Tax=Eucalyptus grandis TaxID=71139 RepID=UPI00192EAB50|nr:apoptosis inhibitor 5-like protein API5 [Eucalyptus grandis]XP_039167357.1 apoptosis inhibitor 5-like protein API5 [Eucalyptus grandis]